MGKSPLFDSKLNFVLFISFFLLKINSSTNSSNHTTEPLIKTDNQTEIIYTVFVNGIPVLATIAASDMKLMTEAEVSKLLENSVFTKAERIVSEF